MTDGKQNKKKINISAIYEKESIDKDSKIMYNVHNDKNLIVLYKACPSKLRKDFIQYISNKNPIK